jgi:hypothetical protein
MTDKKRGGKEGHIGDLVEQLLTSKGLTAQLKKYQTWSCWDDVVGPQIARYAQPLRIRGRILEVRVSQSTWMQQLQLLKPKILIQLNERLEENLLDDIFLKSGPIKTPAIASPSEPPPTIPLDDEDHNQIDEILEGIDDPDIRKSLSSLIGLDFQAKKTSSS